MRSGLLFILMLSLVLPAVAAIPVHTQSNPSSQSVNRNEMVVWQEDFESGAPGWTHYDGAQPPNNWHIHNYGGIQGNVWWMGDPALASGANIGGYYDHQYLVLDTPARTLTATNATLTFKMRLGLEDPSENGGYDGWDSANVRISTNGGTTWNVIAGSPAYHCNNSYAFGFEHGEGMGIPGWGGVLTNWTNATFDLSAYLGQSVKIRFAFASDPATSTVQQPDMFGFMVDDISFGGYTNIGVSDGQMIPSSLVPLGGDLWHLATEASAPSPTHVMKNQNAQGSYNDNMLNYLVSPSINLLPSSSIRCDFQIMGGIASTGTFPDVDYWGWEISPDNGSTWNAMSNPYADPAGLNYVYTDVPDTWGSMIEGYSLDGDISNFGGQTVKFRWFFKSNAAITQGPGIMIDDFTIYNDVVLAAPENLAATVDGRSVTLNWAAPGGGRREYVLAELPENEQIKGGSLNVNAARNTRNTGYKIYRDQALLAQVSSAILNYVDEIVPAGIHSYHVTAVYAENESLPSNSVTVTVFDNVWTELSHDDGSSEIGLTVGPTHQTAVFFDYGSELIVKHAKFYVHTPGTSPIFLRLYDNDGMGGMPGTQLTQTHYGANSVEQGWNTIELLESTFIPDGSFYLGILQTTGESHIGVDTSSSGNSFTRIGPMWDAYTNGNIMIRAIVQTSGNVLTQSIPLAGGWNLVSLNVSPEHHTLDTVLAPISAFVQQVKGTEGIYIPGNPYSTLSAIADGKAYNIQLSSGTTWNVTGEEIAAVTPLPLLDGWNLTAYLPQNSMVISFAMQSIAPWLQQVKGSDGVYIPGNPYSSLGTMYPGKGYWINLVGAHSFTYPYVRYAESVSATVKPRMKVSQLPSSMVLLARCDWANPGDILIAKVNGELRGAEELIAPEGFPAALLQIYTTAANEEISLYLVHADGTEIELANRFSSQPNATLGCYPEFIRLEPKSGNAEAAPRSTRLHGCYPNPFNPDTTISFSIAEGNAMVSINIYNLKGQRVCRLTRAEYARGEHSLLWSGTDESGRPLSSGIYMIELKAGKYRKTIKALMSK